MQTFSTPRSDLPLPINQRALAEYELRFAEMRKTTEALYEQQRLVTMCPPNYRVNMRIDGSAVTKERALTMFRNFEAALRAAVQAQAAPGKHGLVWSSGRVLPRKRSEFWKFRLILCIDSVKYLRQLTKQMGLLHLTPNHHVAESPIDRTDQDYRHLLNMSEAARAYRTANIELLH